MFLTPAISILAIKFYKFLEAYRETKNELEEKEQKFIQFEQDIKDLKSSNEIYNKKIEAIDEKFNTVFLMLQEQRIHNDANKRDDLKDKIAQNYRRFKEKGEWTEMDKESLEGLIAAYERCGGMNSFVHDVVQKEMYAWSIKAE